MSGYSGGDGREPSFMTKTKVLVIDDEAPIRLLCRVNLEAENMDVIEAADGPSGVEKARDERPDVILLDVMMPGLDGWRVAEQLLDDDRTVGIPIIFLTARAEFRDRARGLDIGGVDYITKPFNPLELAPLVQSLLDRLDRGERDELRAEKLSELRSLMESEWADEVRGGPSRANLRACSPDVLLASGEVGRDDARAAVADERPEAVADADPPEARPEQDCAVGRAREPGVDHPVGGDVGGPGKVFAEDGTMGSTGERPLGH